MNENITKRVGYKGFLSLVVMLWKLNRAARKYGIKAKYEIVFPI